MAAPPCTSPLSPGRTAGRELALFPPLNRQCPPQIVLQGSPRSSLYCPRATDLDLAHITVDNNRVIGDIDPKIYGNFIEHLGRCIDGGVFQEGSRLADAKFLSSFVNHANVVKIANMAQFINVIAPIFTNDNGMFLQTIYYPLQLFATCW